MVDNKKIEKIINDNKILINEAKQDILYNKTQLVKNLDYCFFAITFNENNSKKVERFNREKKYILDSIEEISNVEDVDKICDLRKKMNYYLGKMRKELEAKNESSEMLDNLQDSLLSYRKSVARYVRYLKRGTNINQIISLNDKYDSLSDEEKVNLKKIIKREQNYNCKNLKVHNARILDGTLVINKKVPVNKIDAGLIDKDKKSVADYLDDQIQIYNSRYNLKPLLSYDKYFGKNAVKLVRNVPSYLHNKAIIKVMEEDNAVMNRKKDLKGYIEYHKARNSVLLALKAIIVKTYRESESRRRLEDDHYCKRWIADHFYSDELEKEKNKSLTYGSTNPVV